MGTCSFVRKGSLASGLQPECGLASCQVHLGKEVVKSSLQECRTGRMLQEGVSELQKLPSMVDRCG